MSVLSGAIYLGSFIAIFGGWRPCVISHLRENLYSTDVIDCFFLPYISHTSAEPQHLRCSKPAKIIVFFHSGYDGKKNQQ